VKDYEGGSVKSRVLASSGKVPLSGVGDMKEGGGRGAAIEPGSRPLKQVLELYPICVPSKLKIHRKSKLN
jgi:hypothetical protein